MSENGSWVTTPAGEALQAKLNSPQTVAALTRLLDRIDTLEQTVNSLATVVEQGPGMMSMVTDMADDAFRSASSSGVDIDARLRTALSIAEKLTAPGIADKLDQLLTLVEQGPGMLSMVTDMADDTFRQAAANGVDIDGRLRAALEIAEKLTAPHMVERLSRTIDLAEQGPGMIAMAVDMVDEAYGQANAAGFNLEQFIKQGAGVTTKMAILLDSEEFKALMESGVLDPKAVQVIGNAGQAMVASQEKPIEKIGLFGLMRALGDPDLQQALGFLTAFGKEFGRTMKNQ